VKIVKEVEITSKLLVEKTVAVPQLGVAKKKIASTNSKRHFNLFLNEYFFVSK
jgi:hypothetical protein